MKPCIPFFKSHGVDGFLNNDDIIIGLSTRSKTSMQRRGQSIIDRIKLQGKDFGNKLVEGVTKTNWSELVD